MKRLREACVVIITDHEILKFPEVKGIFAGGCVERGEGSRFRAKAHAHTIGVKKGWICVLSAKRLTLRALMLHEAAHVITGLGHVDKWREKVLEIGGTIDEVPGLLKSYRKRRRAMKWKLNLLNCRGGMSMASKIISLPSAVRNSVTACPISLSAIGFSEGNNYGPKIKDYRTKLL